MNRGGILGLALILISGDLVAQSYQRISLPPNRRPQISVVNQGAVTLSADLLFGPLPISRLLMPLIQGNGHFPPPPRRPIPGCEPALV